MSDSTKIQHIVREIKQSQMESQAYPRTGLPIPQPVITGRGNTLDGIQGIQRKKSQPKKSNFFDNFRIYLKQGILFFFLFFLCGTVSFRETFVEAIPYFAQMGRISTFGQVVLALLATIFFIFLQIIF